MTSRIGGFLYSIEESDCRNMQYKFISFLLLNICVKATGARITPLDPECQQPLGLQNGDIPDSKLFAPESAVAGGKEGYYARLYNDKAWCTPSGPGSSSSVFRTNIYITVDVSVPLKITALALQGYASYGYGNAFRIQFKSGPTMFPYNEGNEVPVQNLNGDNYEYLRLSPPIFSSKIQINPQYDTNTKCLRMELYGCPNPDWSSKEYVNCTNIGNGLLTDQLTDDAFKQSDFVRQTLHFDARKLLFSQRYAWCVESVQNVWASINLGERYLIYSLDVDGYRESLNTPSDKYLVKSFKIDYSLDGKLWASYEGGRVLSSATYRTQKLIMSTPLLAQHVRISMKPVTSNITCIKLQIYGCKAVEAQGLTTTPLTKPNVTNNASTPTPEKARIHFYKMPQGNRYSSQYGWMDKKYNGIVAADKTLSRGTGCLTDEVDLQNSNPFKSACWIGWYKSETPNPYLLLTMNVQTLVTGITLQAYINESMGASAIKMFTVKSGASINPYETDGYTCAPESLYHIEPQVHAYTIDVGKLNVKYIKLEFDFAGSWILIRQVAIKQDTLGAGALKLSTNLPKCTVPVKPVDPENNGSGSNIVIIICIILALLFLALLIFVIYRYRSGLHRVFKSRTSGKPIYVGSGYNGTQREDRMLLNTPKEHNRGFENSSSVPYAKVQYRNGTRNDENSNEDVYAAPDVNLQLTSGDASSDKPGYTQVGVGSQYAKYSSPDTNSNGTNSNSLYAQPSLKQQYAEPNHLPENPIYQGSAIYASTYENPYKAVVASSMYTDPSLIRAKSGSQKSTYRVFPREQLSFKEKIGVGQFGEVHIAEATGLDEIYGTIGHYNSWGLPDTALVAVKLLKSEDKHIETEFLKEVEVMQRLKHENVVRLLGICNEAPMLMVVEYMENGDLNQFLTDRKPCDADNVRISQIPPNVLPLDTLLHMAQQIAAGLKYLHSEGFIHRDLATRNCLVGPAYQVKISDFGMSRYLYSKHYYRVEGKAVLPIRWMAPECLFYGKFTQLTDVWSFGVTLWEIVTFARESPYSKLSDPQVIENACESVQNPNKTFPKLTQPPLCPDDLYEIMVKCWHSSPESRPTFAYLYRFFNDKCSTSEGDI